MKITKRQLRQIIKETRQLNEALPLLGMAVAALLASSGGRSVMAKALRIPGDLMEGINSLDDDVAAAFGTKMPQILNDFQAIGRKIQSGPLDELADIIEGLNDEEGEALSAVLDPKSAAAGQVIG